MFKIILELKKYIQFYTFLDFIFSFNSLLKGIDIFTSVWIPYYINPNTAFSCKIFKKKQGNMDANDTTLSTAGETGVMLIIVLTIELEELFFL